MSGTDQEHGEVETVRHTLSTMTSATGKTVRRHLNRLFAGDVLVITVTMAAVLAVGGALVSINVALPAALAGIGMAVTVVLANSESPLARLAGGVAVVGAALLTAVPLALTIALVFDGGVGVITGLAVLWLVLASFAAAMVPTGAPGDGTLGRARRMTVLAGLGILVVIGLRIVPVAGMREQAAVAFTDSVGYAVGLVVSPGGNIAIVSFFGLLAAATLLLRWGTGKPSVERHLPPERRERAISVISRFRLLLGRMFQVSMLATLLTLGSLLISATTPNREYAHVETLRRELPEPAGDLIAGFVLAPTPRWLLLGLCVIGAGIGSVVLVRVALRRGLAGSIARLFTPILGGAVVAVAAASVLADPELPATLVELAPPFVPDSVLELIVGSPAFVAAGIGLLVALGILWWAFAVVSVFRVVRFLPGRAMGVALASISLFGVAVTAALLGRATLAVATAVIALFVWDVGEFSIGLREELPPATPTFRVETVHAGASAMVGLLVGGGTLVAYEQFTGYVSLPDAQLAVLAVGLAAIVTALVAFSVRG